MTKRFTPVKVSGDVRSRPQRRGEERVKREGLPSHSIDSPTLTALTRELYGVLDRGISSCEPPRSGHSWPRPRVEGIRKLVEEYGEEICRRAATQAREIAQAQDRAPNITNLFAKKCADVAVEEADRESRREEIRLSLAQAGRSA